MPNSLKEADKSRSDLKPILKRVMEKRKDFIQYDFTKKKNDILKIFFELAQEFDSLEDFYRIIVCVPFEVLDLEICLYLFSEDGRNLELVCDSKNGIAEKRLYAPDHIQLAEKPYKIHDSYVIPIIRKNSVEQNIIAPKSDENPFVGMLEAGPLSRMNESDCFFFIKYSNRIGFNLHNRMIAHQYIRHIKFINTLVHDIEHNVITPNMYFRHFFNICKKRIMDLKKLGKTVFALREEKLVSAQAFDILNKKIFDLEADLSTYHRDIQKYHANMSLFLESLFRRDHFEKGQLVLRTKKCLVEKEIIVPQLEHYSKRIRSRGIAVERPEDMLYEEIALTVDVGLLAQVYANLFSNAVKYTKEVTNHQGLRRKAVAYGREIIPNYFPASTTTGSFKAKDGIKFNVFTTGPHISIKEREAIFFDGYRGGNKGNMPGTGHGLSFIRQVVEIHEGEAGYEAVAEGNNFFFILPLPNPKSL
ncbi:MAG: ATP-binding protein [Thermodesulfobacteriota bacterium]|nr:ATP-binding protein [Thermodesulfobacteriota bacterium]